MILMRRPLGLACNTPTATFPLDCRTCKKVQGTEKRAARATQHPRKSTQGISIYEDKAAIKVLERASRSFSQCRREKEKRRAQYESGLASVSP